jgi:fermentation-respiration switch protein FrsA (DUF1100 family)
MGRPLGRLLVAWGLAALIVFLLLPVVTRLFAGATGLCFLVEFLTEGGHPWLSRLTEPPVVQPLSGAGTPDVPSPDLWLPGGRPRGPRPGLVLVHGLTPQGKDDPRLVWTAALLARAGYAVAVPELPALRAQRLRPDDAWVVRDTLEGLRAHPHVRPQPAAVIAVSVGLGPVALALADPVVAARVRLLLTLGGYAESRELIRYFTTGAYAYGETAGQTPIDSGLAWAFLARNLDLVSDARDRAAVMAAVEGRAGDAEGGPAARAVLALLRNHEPERVDALLGALPPETRALLDALSPARHLSGLRTRLLLVHGRDDPAVPFTESLRLAAAAPGHSRLVLVGLVGHVEGQAPAWRRLGDLVRLWSVCYELLAG